MEILTKVIREGKDAIEEVLRATSAEGKQKKSSTGDYLHKTVKQVSLIRNQVLGTTYIRRLNK